MVAFVLIQSSENYFEQLRVGTIRLGSAPWSAPVPIPTLTTAGSQRLFSCGGELFRVGCVVDVLLVFVLCSYDRNLEKLSNLRGERRGSCVQLERLHPVFDNEPEHDFS